MACTCQASNAMRWINQTVLDCDRVSWYLVVDYLHWGWTWSPVKCLQSMPNSLCYYSKKELKQFCYNVPGWVKINNLVITKYAMHVHNTIMKNLKKYIFFYFKFQNKSTIAESLFLGIFGWGWGCIIFVR